MKKSKHILCSCFLVIILGIVFGCANSKTDILNKDISAGEAEENKGRFYDERILSEDIFKVKGIEKLRETNILLRHMLKIKVTKKSTGESVLGSRVSPHWRFDH